MKVEFYRHHVGKEELKRVQAVVASLFLTTGAEVEGFESQLAKYLGTKESVGLMSCTGALHLALLAAGVGPGDEVITTPLSFVATANAVLMAGAKPVFVDVEPETGNIDANLIERAITKRTKAILPVHLYGQMADMRKILRIAKKHKLAVLEDAAHALESERDGIRPGTHSFGACFSFYATKSITSGEGGAFASQHADAAKLVRQLRSHGISSEVAQRHRAGLTSYDVDRLGWKHNMSNIQAAFLIPQLKLAEARLKRRTAIAKQYRTAFAKSGIEMPEDIKRAKHGHHLFTVWAPPKRRAAIFEYLKAHGVGATVTNYPPIHLFSFYGKELGYKQGDFPIAESIGSRVLTLPLYAGLTTEEVNYVIRHTRDAFAEA